RLTDEELLRVLAIAAGKGVLVNVHAEDGALVDYLSDALIATGQTGIDQLGPSRPPRAEALATEKMVTYAGAIGCPLYIVHLSSLEALNAVRRGRSAGIEVYVETRPAYLYLDEGVYGLPGQEGNRYACWPPLRSVADQDVLWDAIGNGEVQCYATDHTTWTLAEKMDPKLMFNQVPGGISNVQTSLGMLFSEGVSRGRMSLARFVEVTAQTPARLFGLWPRKGVIQLGADADIVIVDPQLSYRVVSERMESASDFDPYDGYESSGWPVLTMSRGQIVVADQQLLGSAEHGRFYHRAPFESLPLGTI
ncbi:MAG TPA: amidohydrolase family protein, partial [Candidatus Nanopelagicaceae bacterium]